MTFEEKYNQRYQQLCNGEISIEEWNNFCTYVLECLMEENQEVLLWLKNSEW